jgi:hypothetical protein
MEGKRTTRSIGAILSIGALLGGLLAAQPVDARDAQGAGLRDSVVPIVIDAPPEDAAGRAKAADDQSAARANDAASGVDIAADGSAGFLAPLADVPLAAWLLLGTCLLCAGLGPRALRRFEDASEEAAPSAPDQTPKLPKTNLTRPRQSPG